MTDFPLETKRFPVLLPRNTKRIVPWYYRILCSVPNRNFPHISAVVKKSSFSIWIVRFYDFSGEAVSGLIFNLCKIKVNGVTCLLNTDDGRAVYGEADRKIFEKYYLTEGLSLR